MSNGDKPDPSQLPPVSAVDFELSALVRVLERRLPELTTEWIEAMQEEAAADEIIRIRGPRQAPTVLQEHERALARAAQVRLINIALERGSRVWEPVSPSPGPKPGKKKRRA